jgi:hypothetical protein
MPPPGSLKEGNALGDAGWAVAASPDRKRGKEEKSLAADEALKA